MKEFHVGQKIIVRGKKHEATTQKMTKAQVRKVMANHSEQGEGLPVYCDGLEDIISDIQIDRPEKGAGGAHDHGTLQVKPFDDDHELVEAHMMSHIEVTHIESKK